MYTYSRLLLRNFFITLGLCACVAVAGVFLLASHTAEQQSQHQQILLSLDEQVNFGSNEQLASQLAKFNRYQYINIINVEGEVIVNEKSKPSFIDEFILAPISQVKLKNSNLIIQFQLDPSTELSFLQTTVLAVFIISLIFAIFTTPLSIAKSRKFAQKIDDQVKRELEQVISGKDSVGKINAEGIALPQVEQSIIDLRALIANKISATALLEKDAYIEPVTKLENRNRFVQFFENADSRSDFGVLSITRCSELQTINQIHGYHEGDTYIRKVADIMKNAVSRYKGAQVFRLNSSDFATLIPNISLKSAEAFATELTNSFNKYQQASDLDSIGYTGLVYFDNDKPLGELLALADTGISVAQTQKVNAWYAQTDTSILDNSSASYGNQNWRQEIDSVIANQRVNLLVQPIKPSSPNNRVYGEILTRFLNSNEDVLPTASFFAMAEKLDKIVAVDQMIIEAAIKEIANRNMQDNFFGINVSSRSINDGHFLIWLERRLLRDTVIASKLVFEITESGLQHNIKTSKNFIDMVHRVGARITVERFGIGLTSFKFFRDLKPDFIKMDSTYTRDIDEDKNNQYFMRLMVDLAHRLSISVLAESVESQEEKFMLEKLFVDGCQGFYIGKPRTISSS
ncbi:MULTISPECIES: EAL domain-containing protein [unclassified Colwellia]|jgi:EAL domain-containing protein (putative c-di-GMP-specific phosphodiesterase class I)/GGDEF domain-containing protein|uniref:EAL domain-containing protein n=1 Tax=unclassified Colwellia TaxID=196834 RepID=UPI000D3590D6|nr:MULTISPECIES: EAL domain-containing protein [unclassified Colwellia]AWB57365.1 GGDEF domain-containing protein [Colwellia sp. Arc7-D]MBA6415328.1 EAL domain-containing protein [Colwellia sp. 6M3]|tara:strand:+ start:283 stop:2169 length:1887 start_codon:yes stop_codon:yes gene_type:complete